MADALAAGFVHLRVHTEYSLVDSDRGCRERRDAGRGTDGSNQPCRDDQVLPRGARSAVCSPSSEWTCCCASRRRPARPSQLTLLCQTLQGYRNLARLISRAYLQGQTPAGIALGSNAWLTPETTQGLIALSAGAEGDVGRALLRDRPAQAEQALDRWLALFGDRFLYRAAATGSERRKQATCPQRWRSPRVGRCRWLPPTMCAFCVVKTSRRTRRACAFTMGHCWPIRRDRVVIALSSICAVPRRCAHCFMTCPRRWKTPCRSRVAAVWCSSWVSRACRIIRCRTTARRIRCRTTARRTTTFAARRSRGSSRDWRHSGSRPVRYRARAVRRSGSAGG